MDDIPYEDEILRHPYTLKCWLRYIEHKKNAPEDIINMVYERALKELPGRLDLINDECNCRGIPVFMKDTFCNNLLYVIFGIWVAEIS